MSEQRPLFSVGTRLSTRALEIGAIILFISLSLLSILSGAYEIAILFAIIALLFIVVYLRMTRFDFFEESLRIHRRSDLLREIKYTEIEKLYSSKTTPTMPPQVSLIIKNDPKKLTWVGNPKNKELRVDLISWLNTKVEANAK